MKDLSPREISLLVSASLAIFMMIVLAIWNLIEPEQIQFSLILLIPLLLFFASLILVRLYIERFIYRKVKVIYKAINNLKAPKGQRTVQVDMNQDVLNRVENEVLEWARNKTLEIESLRQMETYRKDFLGNVSHELKTPIFNIQGYLHTLADGGLEDPKINANYLHKAIRNLERLNNIIEDLEVISQYESNMLHLELTRFDVVQLIKEVFEDFEMHADLKDIRFDFKKGQARSVFVEADRDRIRQVLTNLISNSVKYGKQEGNTTAGVYDMDENILVEITDDGIGIAKEHLPRLFERFYRVDKSRSRDAGGTGLGLAIVKHIIEAHQKTINVRSTPGVGTTFGFTLKKG